MRIFVFLDFTVAGSDKPTARKLCELFEKTNVLVIMYIHKSSKSSMKSSGNFHFIDQNFPIFQHDVTLPLTQASLLPKQVSAYSMQGYGANRLLSQNIAAGRNEK
jgi:hypothetical protein